VGGEKTKPIQSQSPGFPGNPKHSVRSPWDEARNPKRFEKTKPISEPNDQETGVATNPDKIKTRETTASVFLD